MLSLQLIDSSSPLRMSTVEIAALIGKQHKNLLRTARKVVAELAESHGSDLSREIASYESTYLSERGRQEPCLLLPHRETMILLVRTSTPFAAKVYDRWIELERLHREADRPAIVQQTVIEPPAELFPMNPVERTLGSAMAVVKDGFKWMKNSIWQAHREEVAHIDRSQRETKAQIDASRAEDKNEHGHLWKQGNRTHEAVERLGAGQRDVVREVREVGERLRFITRTREPNLITMADFLRELRLELTWTGLLSSAAAAWFTERQLILRTASRYTNLRANEFDRPPLERWWKEVGERLYKQFLDKRPKPPVLSLVTQEKP